MNVLDFSKKKSAGVPITMVTCYDSWSAALIAGTSIDCVLVGDSLAMVIHGHDTTLPADIRTMAAHTAAVRRGGKELFIISDMPFLSFRKGVSRAVRAAGKLMRAGANAIKLEGAAGNLEVIRHLVEGGIPVMGHLGLTPQSVHHLGGFRVQGRGEEAARKLAAEARNLEQAGCFAVVLEAVPAPLAREITASLEIPTIGIGAGPACDGQVLVLQDLLGLTTAFRPKFLRTWLDGATLVRRALDAYHEDVVSRAYPGQEESYQ